jgi:hypothetical protein
VTCPSDPSLTIQRLDREETPIRVSLFGRALDLKVTGMKLTPAAFILPPAAIARSRSRSPRMPACRRW